MQSGLSAGQTLLVASIPAVIALLGVVVTVFVGQRQAARAVAREDERRRVEAVEGDERATRQRRHEAEVERDRLLRADRLTTYRRLVRHPSAALQRTTHPAYDRPTAEEALVTWRAELAELPLIARAPVIEAAEEIEKLLSERFVAKFFWDIQEAHSAPGVEREEDEPSDDDQEAGDREQQNRVIVGRLVSACRYDLGSLGTAQ